MYKTLRFILSLTFTMFFILAGSVCAQDTGMPVDAMAPQVLSPEQRRALEAEMSRSGNVLSPEAIKSPGAP
jgi:hypothetical protein